VIAVPHSFFLHPNKIFLPRKVLQTNPGAVLNAEQPVNNNPVAVVTTVVAVAVAAVATSSGKCMTQSAPPVVQRRKFLSVQAVIALFSVENASDKIITDVKVTR
jgi:hypothetical protein